MLGSAMNHETIGVIILFAVFMAAVILGSTGESYPVLVPKKTTVTVPFSIP